MIIDFWKTFIYALRAYVSYVCGELGSTTSKHGGWILADVQRKLQIFCTEAVLSFFLPTKQAHTERFDFWAPTWCTFSEGSYSINRITTEKVTAWLHSCPRLTRASFSSPFHFSCLQRRPRMQSILNRKLLKWVDESKLQEKMWLLWR